MNKIKNKIVSCISVAALFLVSISNANAQDNNSYKKAEFGFRLMPTFTSLQVQTSTGGAVSGNAVLGFGAGAFLGFNFSNHVGIQGELIYSSISQKSYDFNVERKINLRYVNIPILLSLNTGKSKVINLNVVAGPQIGFNVGSSLTMSGANDISNPQPVLSVKKNDFGFAYGAGIDFGLNTAHTVRLGLGYRGVIGLIDVSDKSKSVTTDSYYVFDRTHVKTNSVYIGLSILF
ncbi:MAG TPA: porin family protein [Bacteroidia bacterium]|nr:porin family protein [Bacteroidia bacterium]